MRGMLFSILHFLLFFISVSIAFPDDDENLPLVSVYAQKCRRLTTKAERTKPCFPNETLAFELSTSHISKTGGKSFQNLTQMECRRLCRKDLSCLAITFAYPTCTLHETYTMTMAFPDRNDLAVISCCILKKMTREILLDEMETESELREFIWDLPPITADKLYVIEDGSDEHYTKSCIEPSNRLKTFKNAECYYPAYVKRDWYNPFRSINEYNVINVQECKSLCDIESACLGFTYNSATGNCVIKFRYMNDNPLNKPVPPQTVSYQLLCCTSPLNEEAQPEDVCTIEDTTQIPKLCPFNKRPKWIVEKNVICSDTSNNLMSEERVGGLDYCQALCYNDFTYNRKCASVVFTKTPKGLMCLIKKEKENCKKSANSLSELWYIGCC